MAENKYIFDNPVLLAEWDWEKNSELGIDPSIITSGSSKKVWWICKNNHSWEDCISHRTSGGNCPYCSNRRVLKGYNDLQSCFPELACEWDEELNFPLSPDAIYYGSSAKIWWCCQTCQNKWLTSPRSRTLRHQTGCPKCANTKRTLSHHKTFISKNGCITDPLLLKEWNYPKNVGLTPYDFTPSSNQKVWWICSKCEYEWEARIGNRYQNGRGCPCCSNQVVIPGRNDLATVNPQLAKEWHPSKNKLSPSDVTIGSGKKVWWICPIGHEYLASILHRGHGTNCPICNSGRQTSFAEQAIYYYVKQMFPDAINRCSNVLDSRMELDIYIPSLRVAIEYDGSFWHRKPQAKAREKKKYEMCREKGISLWRIREDTENVENPAPTTVTGQASNFMDVKASRILYADPRGHNKNLDKLIYDTLMQLYSYSRLISAFHKKITNIITIDLDRDHNKILACTNTIIDNSLGKLYPELAMEWDTEKNSPILPEQILPGSSHSFWWNCSKCGHSWKTSVYKRANGTGCPECYKMRLKTNPNNTKRIYQYTKEGIYIKEWNSISAASRELQINNANIQSSAQGKRAIAGGYRWSYEYVEKLPSIQKKHKSRKGINGKPIIQINSEGNVVNHYISLNEAQEKTQINATSISKALNGHIKTAGGFYWEFSPNDI